MWIERMQKKKNEGKNKANKRNEALCIKGSI